MRSHVSVCVFSAFVSWLRLNTNFGAITKDARSRIPSATTNTQTQSPKQSLRYDGREAPTNKSLAGFHKTGHSLLSKQSAKRCGGVLAITKKRISMKLAART